MNPFWKYFILFFFLHSFNSNGQTGCTDYQATNFDPAAVTNDGNCIYPYTVLPLTFKTYIDTTFLSETSGLANQNNKFWTQVDDAVTAIYRIDTLSDSIFQKITINNATNNDWENVSADNNYIYVGDIGNNSGNRTNLCFYKISKSNINSATTNVNAGKINFSYADQLDFSVNHNHNFYECEAFFISDDSIHLFTKGWVNKWTKHYVLSADTGTHVAQFVDSFFAASLVTSAAIQGDSLVVLLGINFSGGNNCYVMQFNKFDGTRYFSGNKRRLTIGGPLDVGQAEAICIKSANKGYITNERSGFVDAQLREFDLTPYLRPAPPSPVLGIPQGNIIKYLQACGDSGTSTFTIKNYSTFAGQDLIFSIGALPAWLTAFPDSDTLAPGDSVIISLNSYSGSMNGGAYLAFVSIHSNDPFHPDKNISFNLNVNYNPCMNYIYTSDTCSGNVDFTSTSINIPTTYYWDFDDGDTSSSANPSHQYTANGNYIVKLIGCNPNGCDTVVQNVNVSIHDGPIAANCYPVTQNYCCGTGITHLKIEGPAGVAIDNSSSDASVGYEDFTCLSPATMITNTYYNLTCTTAPTFSEFLKIWLDLNNDGIINLPNEELYSDMDSVAPVHSGAFTIPALIDNVYGVPLRMRVASDFQNVPGPCNDPQYGQHEDYSIILNLSTVDVNDLSSKTLLNIYQDPFDNQIHFSIQGNEKFELNLYDISGKLIHRQIVNSEAVLNTGNFSKGVYFYVLRNDDSCFTGKIIK